MTSLDKLPYYSLQVIASFMSVDDRYEFAACSLQLLDATDTDFVWYIDGSGKGPSHGDCKRMSAHLARLVPTIEAPLPRYRKNNSETEQQRERRIKHLEQLLLDKLPPSTRCATSVEHRRFRVLAVATALPRTVLFLDNDMAAHPSGSSELSNPVKFLFSGFGPNSRRGLDDEAEDVMGPDGIKSAFEARSRQLRASAEAAAAASSSASDSAAAAVAAADSSQKSPPARRGGWANRQEQQMRIKGKRQEEQQRHHDHHQHQQQQHKWLQRWCLVVNAHAHEVVRAVRSVDEVRISVQVAGIANLVSLGIYGYIALVSSISRGVVNFLSFFDWSRQYFSRYIIEGKLQALAWHNFSGFPNSSSAERRALANDLRDFFKLQESVAAPGKAVEVRKFALRHVLGRQRTDAIFGADSVPDAPGTMTNPRRRTHIQHEAMCRAVLQTASNGTSMLLNESFRGAGQGLPNMPLWTLITQCLITGGTASYLGGRCPSLHQVPVGFASTFHLRYKILFDILRTTVQHNLDATLFFIFERGHYILDTVMYLASGTEFANNDRWAVRFARKVLDATMWTPYRFLVPQRVREGVATVFRVSSAIRNTLIWGPLHRFVFQPLRELRDRTHALCFGQMTGPAVCGFLASTALNVAVTSVYEHERLSYKRTVKSQGFGRKQTILSHALFACSLMMLRWKLYCSGVSFWKVTAIEAAVRIGCSFLELSFAKLRYRTPQSHSRSDNSISDGDDW